MFRRCALALLLACSLFGQKRALTASDYDSWRHIQNQALSNDGRYLAYALFPQAGDGALVVRDLKTNTELRETIGELPPPPPPNYSNPQAEEMPPPPPGIAVKFSSNSRFLVFSTFPTHASVETAKREKRKPEDMPKGDVVIVDLLTSAVFRAPHAKDFQLPSEDGAFVAYLQMPPKPTAKRTDEPSSGKPHKKEKETGTLILRNLLNGTERQFPGVAEYTFTRNAKLLVYAVELPGSAASGVYAFDPAGTGEPVALLAGKGKFEKLAWDEDQTRLAFVSNCADVSAAHPQFKLYTWDRHAPAAVALVSGATAGFPVGSVISDKASLFVAKGGTRIFFGTAPDLPAPKPPDSTTPEDERVAVDLWSWKDDYIQPMQKIRAGTEHSRSYRAVYDLDTRKFVQLASEAMNDVVPSDDGLRAIGNDDRPYRRLSEYDANYADSYLVDTATGERQLIAQKHINRITWSPTGKYAVYFNGKDWISISTADTRAINLTSKLGVSFANEQHDTPGLPDSYRLGGWSRDGRFVLIYDRYDIWRCTPDGKSAVNLTQGAGRKQQLQFRVVRFETDDPASRWLDPDKPLLLRTENDQTHATGFYTATLAAAAAPKKLILEAKNFATPIKARNAEVYVTAASTFSEYPDLLVTDRNFHEFRKVSDANPQMAGLFWGTAELLPFKSADGVGLQSILYKPANFDPAKKYPLIVYIYERLSQNVNNFVEPRPYNSINPSVYASNGYLVLEPDIAYKIGYPGQSALNCVLPAIQSAVDRGFVNEAAIGIQGHSWGGYQIAYMITRTNRFRAAAAGAPVADMISAYDGIRWGPGLPRQFQYERTQSRIGGSVWEYPLRYIENSPIFMADRVNTPLLMIHNDADDAVPWYQGIEFYLAMRRLNKEVYLFSYNGEPHNLRRRANQKDYALRLQQFFDYQLKGAPEPDWMKHGIPYLEKPGVRDAMGDP